MSVMRPSARSLGVTWTPYAILDAILKWNARHGQPPRDLEWRRPAPGRPTSSAVRKVFGYWSDAIRAAGLEPDPRGMRR